MRIGVNYGREREEYEIAPDNLLSAPAAAAPSLTDPGVAVRAALEQPFAFPALRRALTPDDHLVVVLDETLSHVGIALTAILEHVTSAGVVPENVTLLCPPWSHSVQAWIDDLPETFQETRLEVHQPDDRNRLAYLATTRAGKRLYLNRTLVEADQIIVLSSRRYDLLLGVSGAAGAIYPDFCDAETRAAMKERIDLSAPGSEPWPTRLEAVETAWLLGAPFFVQIIEGRGDDWAHVIAGTDEACTEAERLLDARWRVTAAQPADVVIAGLSGDPARHTFADLARAAACAARVVRPDGRIVLLTQANPDTTPETAFLMEMEEPQAALKRLHKEPSLEMIAALQWANAATRARLYLLTAWPDERVEELFATPLEHAQQAQRLIDAGGLCLVLDDAHKTLAVPAHLS
jgi:nickel-dependent lactate racemase